MDCLVSTDYISASCNRTPGSMDWGQNLICYGTCNSVMICNPNYNGINYNIKTLYKHTGRVNSVQWLHGNNKIPQNELISGSSDKTAIVWQLNGDEINKTCILQGHNGAVTVVDGLYLEDFTIIATGSVDSTVKIWLREKKQDFVLLQDITLGKARCLSLKLFEIPNMSCPILALGLDNDKIYLYAGQKSESTMEFMKLDELIGHEDWIRGLDFTLDNNGDILLASSSQDTYIRLWKIFKKKESENTESLEEKFVQDERAFQITSMNNDDTIDFSVVLESVLSGHENWVYGVHWNNSNGLRLLSSSMDKTMIIWKFDEESGIWLEHVRVGEVGGNSLGFYGGKFSPDGENIMGHGYQGSFHLWIHDKESWIPTVTIGGHFDEVIDLSWEPSGEYLLTVSMDQTTRLHAKWKSGKKNSWHELSRPQVHGYDMSCIASLTRYNFVSGGEEKVIRSFQATHNFVENFRKITLLQNDSEGDNILKLSIKGASVPSLGLSNKAVYDNEEPVKEKHVNDIYPENYFVALDLSEPPTEDNLMQNTLWPEVQKLYGHGYEIFCIAASNDSKIVASACKANNLEHASIIIWNTSTWKQIQKLESHQLTVTQLEFSPDDKYLLSVSRDRRWTLFERFQDDNFGLISTTNKQNGVHSRIIWCCAWSFDSKYFLTGSREGKVAVWGKSENLNPDSTLGSFENIDTLSQVKDSVTSLAVGDRYLCNDSYLIAIGTEVGKIYLYEFNTGMQEDNFWKILKVLDEQQAHHLTVKRLKFRPDSNQVLASCGSDHILKIHNIRFDEK